MITSIYLGSGNYELHINDKVITVTEQEAQDIQNFNIRKNKYEYKDEIIYDLKAAFQKIKEIIEEE